MAFAGAQLVQADSIQPVTTGGTSSTGTSGTTADPNDYTCTGQIRAGNPEAGTPGTQVQYRFSCDGPITGYQINTEPHQVEYYDASPVLTLNDKPTSDNFECEGITPGYAINCVGASSQPGEVITGQFSIPGKLTTEPELDAILTVTDATATATATATAPSITVKAFGSTGSTTVTPKATATVSSVTVTDAISGPFDLGRPVDVKHDEFSHDTRLGNTPQITVLVTKSKSGAWVTTPVPLDGTTGTTGVGGAPKAHHRKSTK
ncbi:MAG: hypothetical protein ABSC56_03320 [Solirubrobacteraceae bacterium]